MQALLYVDVVYNLSPQLERPVLMTFAGSPRSTWIEVGGCVHECQTHGVNEQQASISNLSLVAVGPHASRAILVEPTAIPFQ